MLLRYLLYKSFNISNFTNFISLVKVYSSGKTGMQTNFIHDHESEFLTLTFCPLNVVKDENNDPAQYYEI